MWFRWLAVPVLTAAMACPAAAQDEPGMAPSSPWILDYDTDSCAMRRMFGEGQNQAYIELRRFEHGLDLQTIVASNDTTARRAPERFRYRFGEDADWQQRGVAALEMAEGFSGALFISRLLSLPEYEALEDPLERTAYIESIDWKAMEMDAAAKTSSITLRDTFRRQLSLQFGPLDKPMAALNQCIDELMTHWDIDIEAHKTLSRPALPINLPEVPSMIDYPPKMLRQSMPGLVNIRLAIDATGRVTACHIQMPLSDPAFEETSCVDIQHAIEFEPALDKNGNPIASYYVTKIHFRLAG
jgi:hypothetical protein